MTLVLFWIYFLFYHEINNFICLYFSQGKSCNTLFGSSNFSGNIFACPIQLSTLNMLPWHNQWDLFVIQTSGWLASGSNFRNGYIFEGCTFPTLMWKSECIFFSFHKNVQNGKGQWYKSNPNLTASMTKYRMEQNAGITFWSQEQQE